MFIKNNLNGRLTDGVAKNRENITQIIEFCTKVNILIAKNRLESIKESRSRAMNDSIICFIYFFESDFAYFIRYFRQFIKQFRRQHFLQFIFVFYNVIIHLDQMLLSQFLWQRLIHWCYCFR